ncbi:hypothetical protein JCM8547_002194 [Rhodosporidiobolus lusitaniae]
MQGNINLKDLKPEDEVAATFLAQTRSDTMNNPEHLNSQAVTQGTKGPHLDKPEQHKELGTDDVHHFEGQDPHERERLTFPSLSSPSASPAAGTAADAAEALPHHGFLPGDL